MQVCRFMRYITDQIGVKETGTNRVKYWDDYKSWTGVDYNGEPWCAMFVTWIFVKSGKLKQPTESLGWHINCQSMIARYKQKGKYVNGSDGCKSGYVVFFDWDKDGVADHVGFCEYVTTNYINTVEGNASDQVKRCRRKRSDVIGYAKTVVTL